MEPSNRTFASAPDQPNDNDETPNEDKPILAGGSERRIEPLPSSELLAAQPEVTSSVEPTEESSAPAEAASSPDTPASTSTPPTPADQSPVDSEAVVDAAQAGPTSADSATPAAATEVTPAVGATDTTPLASVTPGVIAPAGVVSSDFSENASTNGPTVGAPISNMPVAAPRGRSKKPLLAVAIALVVLVGGAAAYYFGYYMNPSTVISQSLSHTGKGYDALINYADSQQKMAYKGSTGSGSYSIKSDGMTIDGNLNIKSNSKDSDTTFDIGASGVRANFDVRTIQTPNSTTPDFYLKADGITGLGDMVGDSSLNTALNQLNDKWIEVDHTLVDNLEERSNTGKSATNIKMPTHEQIMSELQAFGQTNKQYVFTTKKNKAIAKVVKTYGKETVNGHSTYHYQMALDKDNVKAYLTAQRDALKASSLNDWIAQNKYQDQVTDAYTSMEHSADSISSKDTFDIWADTKTRLVYKVRFSDDKNPAANYAEIGLDYTGNSSNYPLFFDLNQNQDGDKTTAMFTVTIDTKANTLGMKLNVKNNADSSDTVNANLTFKQTNDNISIETPTGAETLQQAADSLGAGDLLNEALRGIVAGAGSTTPASDTNFNTLSN